MATDRRAVNDPVEIMILGPVEVWDAGGQVQVGGTKQRAVLAVLALSANQVVSGERLVDDLWGDRGTPPSLNSIQVYVSRLRRLLGPDRSARIERRNRGYVLQVDPERLDLVRFERLVRLGTEALDRSPRLAASTLREALDLWRGPALAEFRGLPFVQAAAAGLDERHLAALGARVDADLMLGRHGELLAELETLTARHPLHERFHHQLMLALYRSGRQADALEHYRRLRGTLSDELGIEPSRAIHDLEEAVLNHDPRLDWEPPPTRVGSGRHAAGGRTAAIDPAAPDRLAVVATTITVPPAERPPRRYVVPEVWNVPARNPHFVGRDDLLTKIRDRLTGQDRALVIQALHGLGGVGKTQLAIEYAHRHAGDYPIVWWIDAQERALIPEQFGALARALRVDTAGSRQDNVKNVLSELNRRSDWLLIFDNAEAAGDVAPYRPGGAGHILVTSRRPDWGALGGRLPVDVMGRSEAVDLLRRRIDSVDPDLAAELAAELGDLPLAIAQAAAYLEHSGMPAEDYLRHFSTRRSALLARGDVLDYQGRVDTTWLLSLDRMSAYSPAALTLMQLCSLLGPDPIPMSLLAARPDTFGGSDSTGDAELLQDAIGEAVGYSLVRRLPDGIQVHRLVQAVIRKRMTPDEHAATSTTVANLLAAADPGAPHDPANWSAYGRLVPHLLAFGAEADRRPDARRLVIDTVTYLNLNADNVASRRLGEGFLARWTAESGPDFPDALVLAGHLMLPMVWMGDVAEAAALGEQRLPLARRALGANHPATLRMAGYLVMCLVWVGRAEEGRALAHGTMAQARRSLTTSDPDMLRLGTYLSLALAWVGDPAARPIAREVLDNARSVLGPSHPTTLFAAVDLAFGLIETGDATEIRALGEDTLRRSTQSVGRRHLLTFGSAAVLAQALTWEGDVAAALELGREYLDHTRYHLGSSHLITLTATAALASARAASTDGDDPLTAETLVGPHTALGPDHPISLITAAAVSRSMRRRRHPEAVGLAADTLARSIRRLGIHHPVTVQLRQDAEQDG